MLVGGPATSHRLGLLALRPDAGLDRVRGDMTMLPAARLRDRVTLQSCETCKHRERELPTGKFTFEQFESLSRYVCPWDRPEFPNGTNCPLYAPWATVDGD